MSHCGSECLEACFGVLAADRLPLCDYQIFCNLKGYWCNNLKDLNSLFNPLMVYAI